MKAKLITVQLCIVVALACLTKKSDAQTIISFDSSPDNTMVLKIYDPKLNNTPDKIILIFDSTTLTCEFADSGLIALHATDYDKNSSGITSTCSWTYHDGQNTITKNTLQINRTEKLLNNEINKEDTLYLEDWMLHPNEWIKNRNL